MATQSKFIPPFLTLPVVTSSVLYGWKDFSHAGAHKRQKTNKQTTKNALHLEEQKNENRKLRYWWMGGGGWWEVSFNGKACFSHIRNMAETLQMWSLLEKFKKLLKKIKDAAGSIVFLIAVHRSTQPAVSDGSLGGTLLSAQGLSPPLIQQSFLPLLNSSISWCKVG